MVSAMRIANETGGGLAETLERTATTLRSQHAMEMGDHAMQPLDYRVLSKRLRQALAALPESTARGGFSELPLDLLPLAAEALETRHFERHGELFGLRASLCRDVADAFLHRLRQPGAN